MFKILLTTLSDKKRFGLLKVFLISVGVVILLISIANVSNLNLMSVFNGKVLLGFFISQVALLLYSLRFQLVMKSTGITLKIIDALRINTLAVFYHFFTPLSMGADLTKFIKLKRNHDSASHRITSIVFDHIVGICSLVVLSTFLFFLRKPELGKLGLRGNLSIIGVATCALIITVIIFRKDIKNIYQKILLSIKENWSLIFIAFCSSIIMHMTLAAGIFVGSHGIGVTIPYIDILFVLSISMILQSVPVSILGVGATEVASAAIYTAIGLPVTTALLLVALLYTYRLITSVAGGIWQLIENNDVLSSRERNKDVSDSP
jgi:uncharacterized membrane protein YbhN (UPF0104 family)